MRVKVEKKAVLSSIQLIILLFTIVYGMSVFAATPAMTPHQDKAFKPTVSAGMILMAKGQPYVPPKKNKCCSCTRS